MSCPSECGPLGLGHAETAALLTAVAREPCAWVNGGFTDQLINTTIQPYLTQVTQARGKQYVAKQLLAGSHRLLFKKSIHPCRISDTVAGFERKTELGELESNADPTRNLCTPDA